MNEKRDIPIEKGPLGLGNGVLLSGSSPDIGEWFLVGAPLETINDCIQCGIIYLYIIDYSKGIPSVKLKLKLYPGDETGSFSLFGYTGSKFDETNMIYISSPFASENKGAIWKFDLLDSLKSIETSEKLPKLNDQEVEMIIPQTFITGPSPPQGSFGASILAFTMENNVNDDSKTENIFIGIPFKGFNNMDENDDNNKLQGALAIYFSVSNFPNQMA